MERNSTSKMEKKNINDLFVEKVIIPRQPVKAEDIEAVKQDFMIRQTRRGLSARLEAAMGRYSHGYSQGDYLAFMESLGGSFVDEAVKAGIIEEVLDKKYQTIRDSFKYLSLIWTLNNCERLIKCESHAPPPFGTETFRIYKTGLKDILPLVCKKGSSICDPCKHDFEDVSLSSLEEFARGVLGFGCPDMLDYLAGNLSADKKRPAYANDQEYLNMRFKRRSMIELFSKYSSVEDFLDDEEKMNPSKGLMIDHKIRNSIEALEEFLADPNGLDSILEAYDK